MGYYAMFTYLHMYTLCNAVNQVKMICLLKLLSFYDDNIQNPFFWLFEMYST